MQERTVFIAALEKADAAQRRAYLDEACAGDPAMRERVEALLGSHGREGRFLDVPAPEQLATKGVPTEETASDANSGDGLDFLAPADRPGILGRLGHYEILEVIGQGGMGMVLRAFDEKLHRVVAIKVMAAQLATNATAHERFTREAQAAAAVSHDHIVTIHAVEEANHPPYLVMQCVAGMSLQQRLDRDGPLALPEILKIGMQTASGQAAAHAQGLIHRDIKPANILLENGVERVKLTDFGLAQAASDASLTHSEVVAGTPQYMSPEQAEGKPIDQRSDLFSLGSVLYAMCTGRAPFRAKGTMAVLRQICEVPATPIRETDPEIPEWLVAVIAKLHAKDPAERFQTPAEVADILSRNLAHVQHPSIAPLPIRVTRPDSATDALSPSSPLDASGHAPRRRRWRFAAALQVCLLTGLGLSEATGVTQLSSTVIRILTPDGVLVVHVDDPDVKISIEGDGGLVITGAGPQKVRLKPGSYRVQATKDGEPVRNEVVTITRGDKQVVRVSMESAATASTGAFKFTPPPPGPLDALDSAKIPAQDRFVWQPKELVAVLGEHRARQWSPVNGVAFSSDGKLAASGGNDGYVYVWEAATLRLMTMLAGHSQAVWSVVFLPDGRLLSAGNDQTIRLWDVEKKLELKRFIGHTASIWSLAFSPRKRQVLAGAYDGAIRLWDLDASVEASQLTGHSANVGSVAFSPDGTQALSGSGDGTMRLWSVDRRKEIQRIIGHAEEVRMVAFLPDGRRAVSGSHDSTLRLWDLQSGETLCRFHGHRKAVYCVAISRDGHRLLSGGCDETVRLWNVESGEQVWVARAPAPITSVAMSPDGKTALSGGWDGSVLCWDVATGMAVNHPLVKQAADVPMRLSFSEDGRQLIASTGGSTARLWDTTTGQEQQRFHLPDLWSVGLLPGGPKVLTAGGGGIAVWNALTGQELARIDGSAHVWEMALARDGGRAVSAGRSGSVVVWDVPTSRQTHSLGHGFTEYFCVALSPDGCRAITGDREAGVGFWDLEGGSLEHEDHEHRKPVTAAAYSPSGYHAATGDDDGGIRIWNLRGSRPRARTLSHWQAGRVYGLAFAPDGKTLASASRGGRVALWDVDRGELIRHWQLPGPVHGLTFAPDNRHLAMANANGTVYILRLSKP